MSQQDYSGGELWDFLMAAPVDVAIVVTNMVLQIRAWNQGAERVYGKAEEDVIGTTFTSMHTETEEVRRLHTEVVTHGTAQMTCLQQAADGDFSAHIVATVLKRKAKPIGILFVVTPNQDEREMERLRKERAEVRLGAQAKDSFLAMMSHEIRTPLNAIIGMANVLSDEVEDSAFHERLSVIRGAGTHLLSVINDVLDYSKIRAGAMSLSPGPVDIQELFDEALDVTAPLALGKNLDVVSDLRRIDRLGFIDGPRVRQIVVNLLSNAIKFTQSGSVTAWARLEDEELHIRVEDTGSGMSPEDQQRIFRAFEQVDRSFRRQEGGTGLGLAITHQLVTMMHGEIRCRSKLGIGTWFQVKIPCPHVDASVDAQPRFLDRPLEGRNVLIVEDDQLTLDVLRYHMERWGALVRAADNGPEAMGLLANNAFDLLVIDDTLPREGGVGLLAAIRERPATSETPVILLVQNQGAMGRRPELPNLRVIEKPVRVRDLYRGLVVGLDSESKGERVKLFDVQMAERYPLRILVAEDNEFNRVVIEEALGKLGYRAKIVVNGFDAVTAAAAGPYDVVLMDVQMPLLDGLEATKRLRRIGYHAPIVAMSAHVGLESQEECRQAGMDHYLVKPFEVHELRAMLEDIARRTPDRALASAATPP